MLQLPRHHRDFIPRRGTGGTGTFNSDRGYLRLALPCCPRSCGMKLPPPSDPTEPRRPSSGAPYPRRPREEAEHSRAAAEAGRAGSALPACSKQRNYRYRLTENKNLQRRAMLLTKRPWASREPVINRAWRGKAAARRPSSQEPPSPHRGQLARCLVPREPTGAAASCPPPGLPRQSYRATPLLC